jgi:hypothetical protein
MGSGSAAPQPSSAPAPIRVGACGHQQDLLFGPPVEYPPPPGASGALAVGFLNKDAPIDLIVGGADNGIATIAVMLGNGDGTFKPPIAYALPAGAQARSIALTDFDTDEDLDVVSAGGSVPPEVFVNNGDGTFGTATPLPRLPTTDVEGTAVTVGVEDIHGDAHPDVVTYAGGGFGVWHDNGHATFVASVLPAIDRLQDGAGLALADFDRNGSTDIAVAGNESGASVVVVLLGRRGGVFSTAARYRAGVPGKPTAVAAADFDGDGKIDLAALFVSGSSAAIAVLHGKGDGTFSPAMGLAVADANDDSSLLAADLDGDGRADLATTTHAGLAVFRSGAGGFGPPVVLPAGDLAHVAAGDLTGQRVLGLAATGKNGHAIVWPAACQ